MFSIARFRVACALILPLLTTACDLPEPPRDDSDVSAAIPSRAVEPWQSVVARRQAEYAANPNAPQFARTDRVAASHVPVIAANETDPVAGVLTEWVCSSNGQADEWDRMWMAVIGESVRAGAQPYVYLDSYLGDDEATTLQACSAMLEDEQGVAPGQVQWIQGVPTDAMWIRDFGPMFVRGRDSGALSIEDAKYYRGRDNDDVQPVDFGARVGLPVSDFNLYFEGGNLLANGGGLCVTSSVVLDANPHYTETEIRDMFRHELGCDELVIAEALQDFATGHVDMWLAWADHNTLVVGEYKQEQDSVNRAIIENNVATLLSGMVDPATGDAIEIVRMPMPSNCSPQLAPQAWYRPAGLAQWESVTVGQSCPNQPLQYRIWRTYLNVMPVNGTMVLPIYNQDDRYESDAIRIWSDLGFDVVPVETDDIAPLQGTIHCLTMTMPAL